MNLFDLAEKLEKEVKVGRRKSVAPIIVKRDGNVIKERKTKKVVVVEKTVFKKKHVDPAILEASFTDLKEERKELGKRVYNERYQVMLVLIRAYGVEKKEVESLSLVQLNERLDLEKCKQAKGLEFSVPAVNDEVGDILEGFKIVSSVNSTITGIQGMISYGIRQQAILDREEQQNF